MVEPTDQRTHGKDHRPRYFNRIATLPVYVNSDAGEETAAESIAASVDGKTLIYSDSPSGKLGFVDIADPAHPKPDGTMDLDGEPTSVAVSGPYAFVGLNTSASFLDPSDALLIVDIAKREIVRSIDLGGQPDSVAIGPDGRYVAIAIENERDEDLGGVADPRRGWTQDKVEGLAISIDGGTWVCTDNDGVDDATGETLFFGLGDYEDLGDA